MTEPGIAEQRAAFFARTRRMVALLYALLLVGGAIFAVGAVRVDTVPALLGLAAGFVGTLLLTLSGLVIAVPPRGARLLVVVGFMAAAVLTVADASRYLDTPFGAGLLAGGLFGTAAGVWFSRRRLARDDRLWQRQRELGWTDDPWGWLRRK